MLFRSGESANFRKHFAANVDALILAVRAEEQQKAQRKRDIMAGQIERLMGQRDSAIELQHEAEAALTSLHAERDELKAKIEALTAGAFFVGSGYTSTDAEPAAPTHRSAAPKENNHVGRDARKDGQ